MCAALYLAVLTYIGQLVEMAPTKVATVYAHAAGAAVEELANPRSQPAVLCGGFKHTHSQLVTG